ncbi:MAG: radical SAM protein [Candidatus Aminicenantes bacterium]|nr:radical SAM protein [Candidatus Aminicenantes bacterium]
MKMVNNLKHLALMITEHCNLDCYHCGRYLAGVKSNLDFQLLQRLSEKIKKSSITSVRITGGEPFLVKDIDKIIGLFGASGLNTSIATNGTLLNKQMIVLLKEAKLGALWFSIHSVNKSLHDKLAGKRGAYKQMLNSITQSMKAGLIVNIYFPVSIFNINDCIETLKWLESLGIYRIKLLRLTPFGKASNNNFNHISDAKWWQLAQNIKEQIQFQKSDFKMQGCPPENNCEGRCTALPFKHMNISPSGYIYPCCLVNNVKGMEIGHVAELIEGDWEEMITLFNSRIMLKYNLKQNLIPCILSKGKSFEIKSICPLYSKKI